MVQKDKSDPQWDPEFEALAAEMAEKFLKDCPDICDLIREREKEDREWGKELAAQVAAYIRAQRPTKDLREITTMQRKIRRVIRERSGLWVMPETKY